MSSQEDIAYSEEHIPETIETFRASDLPIICNPSPFNSEDSSSESDSPSFTESVASPSTPTTPASPATSLGAAFTYVGLSSQTSDDQHFSTPKPKRKKYIKRRKFHYTKGGSPWVQRSSKDPSSDTIKVFRPTSSLYRDIRFAKEAKAYNET